MALACGGKGLCCHIGYAHRHCDHCDTVVATHNYNPFYQYPYWTIYGNSTTGQLSNTLNALAGQQQSSHACEVK